MRHAVICLLLLASQRVAAGAGSLDSSFVGTWQNDTPDPKRPGVVWTTRFTVAPDGHYAASLSAGGKQVSQWKGVFKARGGKWSSTTTAGKQDGGPYRLAGDDLELTYKSGKTLDWTKVGGGEQQTTAASSPPSASPRTAAGHADTNSGPPSASPRTAAGSASGSPGPPLIDMRSAEERLKAASPVAAARPASPQVALLIEGADALDAGEGQAALDAFTKASQANDENALLHQARGVALILLEKPKEAYAELDRAQRLKADKLNGRYASLANAMGSGGRSRAEMIRVHAKQNDAIDAAAGAYDRLNGMRGTVGNREAIMKPTGSLTFDAQGRQVDYNPRKKLLAQAEQDLPAAEEEARKDLQNVARQYASHVEASAGAAALNVIFTRAKEKFAKGDVEGADKDLEVVAKVFPEDPVVLLLHARVVLARGNSGQARLKLTKILTTVTDYGAAYAYRAVAEARLGAAARARADLKLAQTCAPKDAEAARPDVEKALSEGTPGEPAALAEALGAAAKSGASFERLVEPALKLERAMNDKRLRLDETYQEEVRGLEAAVRAAPRDPNLLAELARFHYDAATNDSYADAEAGGRSPQSAANEVALAERFADLVLKTYPNHPRALAVKAECLMYASRWTQAERVLKRAATAAPGDPELINALVNVSNGGAVNRENEAAYQRSAKYTGSTSSTWSDSKYVYTEWTDHYRAPSLDELAAANQLDKEAQALRAYIEKLRNHFFSTTPKTAEAHWLFGDTYRHQGQYAKAIEHLQQAIKLRPKWRHPRETLAMVFDKQGRVEDAAAERIAAITLVQTTAVPYLEAAKAQIKRTAWQSASTLMDRGMKLDPVDPRLWEALANTAWGAGKHPEAMADARVVLAIEEATARLHGVSLLPGAKGLLAPIRVRRTVAMRRAMGILASSPQERADLLAPLVVDLAPRVPRGADPTILEDLAKAKLLYAASLVELGHDDEALRAFGVPERPAAPFQEQMWLSMPTTGRERSSIISPFVFAALYRKGRIADARHVFCPGTVAAAPSRPTRGRANAAAAASQGTSDDAGPEAQFYKKGVELAESLDPHCQAEHAEFLKDPYKNYNQAPQGRFR